MAAKKSASKKKRATPKRVKRRAESARGDVLQQLKVISDAIDLGTWEWDIRSDVVTWSKNVFRLFGLSPKAKVSFRTYEQCILPDDRPMVLNAIDNTLRQGTPYYIMHRIDVPGEGIKWIEAFGKLLRTRSGAPRKMIGTVIDVTRKVRNEEERDEWKTRYEMIVNSSGQLIYDYDIPTGNIMWSGDTMGVLGMTKDELGNIDSWVDMIHPDDREHAFAELERAQHELRKYNVHYRFRTKEGAYREMHDSGMFLARAGVAYRMLGVMADITGQITTQRILEEKSHFIESVASAVPDIINVVDLDTYRPLFANKSFLEELGYSREESDYLRKNMDQVLHPNSMQRYYVFQQALDHLKDNEYYTSEIQAKTKAGHWRWFSSVFTVFQRDSTGRATQALGVIRDITSQHEGNLALIESENRYRTLQEASFGGIALHDMGVIIECNQGLTDLTGYPREELIGMDGLLLMAPEYRELALRYITTQYDQTYDAECITKDGRRIAIEVRGKAVPYKGKMIRVTEFRDITERKQFAAKIMEQNQKLLAITDDLRRKNDQLEEFTQIVSHNLRSPVGNILSLLNYYENATEPKEKEQYFALLKESGHNTLLTLNELNEVLKVKQNPDIERQELQFEKVLQNVLTMLHVQVLESGAVVEADFSELPAIHYPNIYLESIFLNLISNSLKYRKTEVAPSIRIKTFHSNGNKMLTVSDNGLGIDLKRNGHLLFRLRKTFHRHPESRGVGLFLIKSQINAMGGDITATSKVNEGITFTIRF